MRYTTRGISSTNTGLSKSRSRIIATTLQFMSRQSQTSKSHGEAVNMGQAYTASPLASNINLKPPAPSSIPDFRQCMIFADQRDVDWLPRNQALDRPRINVLHKCITNWSRSQSYKSPKFRSPILKPCKLYCFIYVLKLTTHNLCTCGRHVALPTKTT